MELYERLKRARLRRFRTAKDASDFLGIPYGTLTGHESGARGVKIPEIVRYAKTYGVELPWLEHEIGPEFRGQRNGPGANAWQPSYLDLPFPIRCQAPECGAEFSIAVRWLISRDTLNCPICNSVIDLKKLKPHIDDIARVAAELDKASDQPK
jgi:hypothetical protein